MRFTSSLAPSYANLAEQYSTEKAGALDKRTGNFANHFMNGVAQLRASALAFPQFGQRNSKSQPTN
jgi:hypothetical protein